MRPVAPDRIILHARPGYAGLRDSDARRIEPGGVNRTLGLLILLAILLGTLLLGLFLTS